MEDSKNVPSSKDSASSADRIIELTPELEIISASRGKIIDLTHALSSPGAAPISKPVPTATTKPKPIVARTASPFSAKVSRQKGIESDVDTAFDYIQSRAEALRGPKVEPTPSEEDLKVAAPSPIGEWDDTIVDDEALMPEMAAAVTEEAPAPEPAQDSEEKPAEPTPSPMTIAVSEAFSVVTSDNQLKSADTPADVPVTPTAEDKTAPAVSETFEILDEEPASLLEAAIEIDEEEAIELTEIVSAEERAAAGHTSPAVVPTPSEADEEEIIELTEIVSAEERAAAGDPVHGTTDFQPQQAQEEEEIIELTEIVSADELAAAGYTSPGAVSIPSEAEEEEIIELTEIVSADELAAAGDPVQGATASQPQRAQEEEEIIELVDRVALPLPEETAAMASELVQNPPESLPEFEPEAAALADLEGEDKDTEEMTLEVFAETQPSAEPTAIQPETDQVIRLDSVLGHVRKNPARISEELTLGVEEALVKETISSGEKFPVGIGVAEVQAALGPKAAPTEEDIEAVIEKIIRTKYGQTIEQMIATVVEKVVTREMNNIRRDLMEDQGESDER
jgi:hypothetical protein